MCCFLFLTKIKHIVSFYLGNSVHGELTDSSSSLWSTSKKLIIVPPRILCKRYFKFRSTVHSVLMIILALYTSQSNISTLSTTLGPDSQQFPSYVALVHCEYSTLFYKDKNINMMMINLT